MTAELVLFIIVAAVAIFSAALMLVSRNAVHSALFLVVNLLCVSFFYMLLHAPFLAMVQITVYAGAIMVLFMFVIMLLGSERLGGGPARYAWTAPAAVGLATVFLVVAFITIVQEQVDLLRPVPRPPELRFTHAVAGAPNVDVYLNNEKVAEDLAYRTPTTFEATRAGDYNLLVFPACVESEVTRCVNPIESGAPPLLAVPVNLAPETATTFVVAGTPDQIRLLTVPTDLSTVEDENTWRLTVVNALPGTGAISFARLNPANPGGPEMLVPVLNFGESSPVMTLPKGTYDFAWLQGSQRLTVIRELEGRGKLHEVFILIPELAPLPDGQQQVRPANTRAAPARTRESFGSPQHIGLELLTTFLLPFELVALLLLAAMVGSILLTREEVIRRPRKRLVVSPVIRRINRSMASNVPGSPGGSGSGSQSGAEASAD